jgi:molybdopterin converting factor small subunit
MTTTFVLPGALRPLAEGRDRVRVHPQRPTVEGALKALWAEHPDLRLRVVDEQGQLRRHVNVFVGSESVRYTGGLDTPLTDGVEIAIIPAVSGGAREGRIGE